MLQTGTLAFLAGILLLQTRAVLPSPAWLYLLPFAVFGILITREHGFRLLCCLLAGFLWAQFQANSLLQQRLPVELTNRNLLVTGFVVSLPQRRDHRIQFEFNISQTLSPRLSVFPHRVRLSWYTENPIELQPGDEWRLSLRLNAPHNYMSPGSFDYSAFLLQKGIIATGYVHDQRENNLLGRTSWRYPAQYFRYHCQVFLNTALAHMPAAGLIKALVIGDRSGISRADWEVLQKTGTVHLMAISGLHIGLVAGFVFYIVMQLWRLVPTICLILPAPKAAAITAWLAALLYAALAGFAIPTQRALIMLAVILFSIFSQRTHKASQVVAAALLLVLLWDPFAVLSASFWLSFCAVAWIYYVLQLQPRHISKLTKWWRMQLAISLSLLPLVIVFFQQAPLLSPFANLIAIPWVSLLVLPLAMLSTSLSLLSHTLASWGLQLSAGLLELLQHVLAWAASLKWSLMYLPAPSWWGLALALIGIAVLLLPRPIPARFLGVLLCLPVFLPLPTHPAEGAVQFSVLDVGQGLSAVVQTTHHTLVFDTGPRFSTDFDTGEAVIVPFLRRQHINAVDTLLISHSDMDHIGGAQSVIGALPVELIISSVPRMIRDARDEACIAGRQWTWDGVKFHILYPSHDEINQASSDNNLSCVLQVTTSDHQILLTGDIEIPAEEKLIARYGKQLHSSILVLPHHGSKTSSSPAFLDSTLPELVIIPAGWHNRFGLPAKAVVGRLQARQLKVLNTATSGTIQIDVGKGVLVRPYREQYQRYWQVW